ncbi:hypothetical protein C3L33_04546, partial [Rhododendron williamsianum]
MKEKKSVKFNLQQQQHQNGHLSPFKFAKLLDPEASWDKVVQLVALLREQLRSCKEQVCAAATWRIPSKGPSVGDKVEVWVPGVILRDYIWLLRMILKIDEEDFGGHGALLQEGLFVSVMLFLYTAWRTSDLLASRLSNPHPLSQNHSHLALLYEASAYCPDYNLEI